MTARTLVSAVACGALILGTAAHAQTPAPASPAPPARDREFIVGGVVAAPASMGSVDAVLLGSNGAPSVTLFRTQNRLAAGAGPEVMLGFALRRSVRIELAAAIVWANVSSRITDDFENAPAEVVRAAALRLAAEGAIVWIVRERGAAAWFVRGSGGFMRESSSDLASAAQGFIGGAGIGYRHWWRTDGRGVFKRLGLRAEVRGVFRAGGITLSERSWTFAPIGAAHIVFGY